MNKMKEKNFVSAVVYVYNNHHGLVDFLRRIHNVLSDSFEKFEVICVNDFSARNSVETIKAAGLNAVTIVNMSYYQGVELSMNAGVDLAIGDFVFEFDSQDMDYPVEMIMKCYQHALSGFDIVSVAPKQSRFFVSRAFYSIFNKYSNANIHIRSEAFRILSRRAINRIYSMNKTIPYRKAVYANSGLKNDVLIYEGGQAGEKSFTHHHKQSRTRVATDSLILFTDVAYRMSIFMTVAMMLLTVIGAGYTLVFYLGFKKAIEGWTTTMLFLSAGFFGVFLILAIIIKYLTVILDLVFKRQSYFIESIERL